MKYRPPFDLTAKDFEELEKIKTPAIEKIVKKIKKNYARVYMCVDHGLWRCFACGDRKR